MASKLLGIITLAFILPFTLEAQAEKPHAFQLAEYGASDLDQQGDFSGEPRQLQSRVESRDPSHVVFGYHPYWNGTAWQDYNYNLLSHVAWFALAMDASGSITNAHGWPVTGLVDLAHSHGVKVIVTVTLFDNDAIATLLASATNRQNAIDNLISRVSLGSADGVNIDFEFVPTSARANFNTFIHDLTEAFHDQIPGSEVSIAMPSVDWWNSYDYDYLSDNCDGLMIMAYGYYYSGSANAGPLSPLNSGLSSWYIRRTIEDYLSKTGDDASQLILGLPWYGIDWPVTSTTMGASTTSNGSSIFYSSAEANAQSYGKNYNTMAPAAWYNYSDGGNRQVWYDDSLSLAAKYNYIKDMDLKGLGIWALGYDGGRQEIWGGLSDAFGSSAPPLAPQYFSVKNVGDGSIDIQCAETAYTDYYLLYTSTDGENFSLIDSSSNPGFTSAGFIPDQTLYVKLKTRNSFGSSAFSELLAVFVSPGNQSNVLIIQGFERTSGTVNNFDYVIEHAQAIASAGRGFDAAGNDAVISGSVSLSDYLIVDWISGEEATATVSFSPLEQEQIMEFLEQGGRLIVSGSEIGYDLEANGSNSDVSFYHDYFKADYIADDAQSYTTYGTSNGIFTGLENLSFDNGFHGSYDVDYPDGIKPYGGAVSNLRFSDTNYETIGGAGIQYLGNFGSSTATGGIVYLSVGFEAFYPESTREVLMERMLDFLGSAVSIDESPEKPSGFTLSDTYPNPFNSSFSFTIEAEAAGILDLNIYDLTGRDIQHRRLDIRQGSQTHSFSLGRDNDLASGVYILRISGMGFQQSQRLTYLK